MKYLLPRSRYRNFARASADQNEIESFSRQRQWFSRNNLCLEDISQANLETWLYRNYFPKLLHKQDRCYSNGE